MGGSVTHTIGESPTADNAQPDIPASEGGVRPAQLLNGLVVTDEDPRNGYDRDLFGYPATDSNGCSTRDLALQRDAEVVTEKVGDCWVKSGRWTSLYDGLFITDPAELHVDHVVALAEAWDSGASAWNQSRMIAFGNDLAESSLRVVSASSNISKSDRDPGEWRPRSEAWCQYGADVVVVKTRWGLTVDPAEHAALEQLVGSCPTDFVVQVAVIN